MSHSRDSKFIPININVSGNLDISEAVSKAIEIANAIRVLNDAQLLTIDEFNVLKKRSSEYATSLIKLEINDSDITGEN